MMSKNYKRTTELNDIKVHRLEAVQLLRQNPWKEFKSPYMFLRLLTVMAKQDCTTLKLIAESLLLEK